MTKKIEDITENQAMMSAIGCLVFPIVFFIMLVIFVLSLAMPGV